MKEKIIAICQERHEDYDFRFHVLSVVRNAALLSEKLTVEVDKEIIEMASYLHDIGRAGKGSNDKDHDILGEQAARQILTDLKMEPQKIDQICHCVLTHRRKDDRIPQTLEAEVVACADSMSHMDTFLELLSVVYVKAVGFEDALIRLKRKIQKDWDQKITLPEARDLIGDKYRAVMLLIQSSQDYV